MINTRERKIYDIVDGFKVTNRELLVKYLAATEDLSQRSLYTTASRALKKLLGNGLIVAEKGDYGQVHYYKKNSKGKKDASMSIVHHNKSLQEIVFEILYIARNLGINLEFISEDQLKRDHENQILPDACFYHGDKKYALELELSDKANSRVINKLNSYKASGDYEKVIYIVKNEYLKKKMVRINDHHTKLSNLIVMTLDSFEEKKWAIVTEVF